MYTLVDCCSVWRNIGYQQDITRKKGKYQTCRDRHIDDGQDKNLEQTDRQSYTRTGMIRTKKPLLFGFTYSTEPKGVINIRYPEIY